MWFRSSTSFAWVYQFFVVVAHQVILEFEDNWSMWFGMKYLSFIEFMGKFRFLKSLRVDFFKCLIRTWILEVIEDLKSENRNFLSSSVSRCDPFHLTRQIFMYSLYFPFAWRFISFYGFYNSTRFGGIMLTLFSFNHNILFAQRSFSFNAYHPVTVCCVQILIVNTSGVVCLGVGSIVWKITIST